MATAKKKPIFVNTEDLLVIRQYEYNGIKVLLELDRLNKKASLVEIDGKNVRGYSAKEWLFAERTTGYLKTWLVIFDAMKYATQEAINELEELEAKEKERLAVAMASVKK